jgi:hypothetical protein
MTPKKKKKKLEVEKRPLEEETDPSVGEEDEADDTQGFFAPPYVPVIPSQGLRDPLSPPNLSPGTRQSPRRLSDG